MSKRLKVQKITPWVIQGSVQGTCSSRHFVWMGKQRPCGRAGSSGSGLRAGFSPAPDSDAPERSYLQPWKGGQT